MKITKSASAVAISRTQKALANVGCQKCPCCGETKTSIEYMMEGVAAKGVSSGLIKTWVEGTFRIRHMRCDCYKCYSCGAEWESDPYQWA